MPECPTCHTSYNKGDCQSTPERAARCRLDSALANPEPTPDISPELAAELGLRPPTGGSEFPAAAPGDRGEAPPNFPHTQGHDNRVVPTTTDEAETPVEKHLRLQKERADRW